jgi:hypothetical protein
MILQEPDQGRRSLDANAGLLSGSAMKFAFHSSQQHNHEVHVPAAILNTMKTQILKTRMSLRSNEVSSPQLHLLKDKSEKKKLMEKSFDHARANSWTDSEPHFFAEFFCFFSLQN